MRRTLALLILAAPLPAQEALTLRQAVDLALRSNPLVAAADAGEKEAEARIHQARSGYLPRVQFSESLQRGNNPVFVFSSLLTQHQFSEANFAIGPLNRPDAMNNYQSRVDGRAGSVRCPADQPRCRGSALHPPDGRRGHAPQPLGHHPECVADLLRRHAGGEKPGSRAPIR